MANLESLTTSIAQALKLIPDLHVYQFPQTPTTPAAQIVPQKVDFSGAMGRGHEEWEVLVRILVSAANPEAAEMELYKYFGKAKDIKDAIENHTPLMDGSVADAVFVRMAEDYGRLYDIGGIGYRGIEFLVEAKVAT